MSWVEDLGVLKALRRFGAAAVLASVVLAVPARADDYCTSDHILKVCVVSAALVSLGVSNSLGYVTSKASVVLQVTNLTDTPLDIAALTDNNAWRFTPENSETVAGNVSFGGLTTCYINNCRYTTFPSKVPIRVEVAIFGNIALNGIELVQAATKASLSGVLRLVQGETPRTVPLPIRDFKFGNALALLKKN